ncbi:MAG: tetratricopeptide repeat protein [Hyphomicrobiaceae bacterium]
MNWRRGAGLVLMLVGLGACASLRAETLLELGARQTQTGNLDDALATYRQAVAAEPRSSIAHTRLGGVLLLRQQHGESIGQFKTAIGLDPANADAFVGLGMAYLHQGRYPLARAALAEALRLKPSRRQEIDQVLAWLDGRDDGVVPRQPH